MTDNPVPILADAICDLTPVELGRLRASKPDLIPTGDFNSKGAYEIAQRILDGRYSLGDALALLAKYKSERKS